jgi:type II secretory pathway pseudopilin PulG
MNSRETNARHRGPRASGFSLVEMVIVIAVGIIVSAISVISLMPLLKAQHETNAYNTTLAALRQARDNAVSQRTAYSVTFSAATTPNTITIAPTLSGGFQGNQSSVTYQYPNDVFFMTPPTGTAGPDGYGTGSHAIDFGYTASSSAGGQNTIYFCPDGSVQTASTCAGSGNWDSGVVYLGEASNTGSDRAVDLWGGTGRIHGWRLYPQGTGYQWVRQ